MKKWLPQKQTVSLPEPVVYQEPLIVPEEKSAIASMPWLECVGCGKLAVLLFEGTSFCRACLQREITTGLKRRFYE